MNKLSNKQSSDLKCYSAHVTHCNVCVNFVRTFSVLGPYSPIDISWTSTGYFRTWISNYVHLLSSITITNVGSGNGLLPSQIHQSVSAYFQFDMQEQKKHQWNFHRNSKFLSQDNDSIDVTGKMVAILFHLQAVLAGKGCQYCSALWSMREASTAAQAA